MMTDKEEPSTIEVKAVGVVKQGTCGFCSQATPVIASEINPAKTICFRCAYKINFQLGKIPAGAVCCFKCKSISGFRIITKQDKTLNYAMTGRDFKGCIKYEKKEKAPSPTGQVKKASCASCGSNLPRWMLEFTSHV